MERRLSKKIDEYMTGFKNNIKDKATGSGLLGSEQGNQLLQYIYDYERLNLAKEDFMKRKRVKNAVPFFDRCCAKRANNEQCTRRKKENEEYCGTHLKGTPHGIMDSHDAPAPTTQKLEVWAQDIQGIIYYIDKAFNVYQAEEILMNKTNPKIIAKYIKTGEVYSIPEFEV